MRAWGPSTGPTGCALAGRHCSLWGWRKGVPGGGAFHHCAGRLTSGAVPPPTARPLGGLSDSATHVLRARVSGCGGPTLSTWPACPVGAWGLHAAGMDGGRPRGGWPATVVRGVWCQALSLPRPPVLWSGQPGFRDLCVPGRVGDRVGTKQGPHSVRPCWPALLAVGVAEGRPRGGGAFHHCEGHLRSGAVPPPTARQLGGLLGSATHVLRARVCGCGGPTLSPWPACPVGASCRGGGGGPSPGGMACHGCGGVPCQALSLPRPRILWSGQPGFRDPCVPGAVRAGVGTQHQLHSVRPCGPALLAVVVAEGRPRGGCLPPLWGASEVRRCPSPDCPPTGRAVGVRHPPAVGAGVWAVGAQHCRLGLHALWGLRAAGVVGGPFQGGVGLPALSGASGVRRCPSPGRPSSGAGSQGSATRVFRMRSVRAWGPSTGPTACPLAGRHCSLWGWREGVPRGGAFHHCEGRLRSGAVPPATARPLGRLLGSATHVLWARVCGCGGPTLSPRLACPVGAARRGGAGLPPLRGASGVRRCPSPGRPSSGAGSRGSATRVSRVRSVRAWGPSTSPTACALAGRRCSLWGWRRGVPGGGAFHHCEGGLRSGALPPPTARSLGGLLGSATHVLWARVCGCWGPTLSPWPACPVGAACRGGGGGAPPGGGGLPPL